MKLFDVYSIYDFTPIRGKDMYVYDADGIEYLDLYGGHAVISIGHSHPHYINRIQSQVQQLGFYSNAVQKPIQQELANALGTLSSCEDYQLFLCNSGAEANENALKLASFHTQKSHVIAFENGFHGRTSAAVAVTDNLEIQAPINQQHQCTIIALGAIDEVEKELQKGITSAVIIEFIQGVGGLDESTLEFYKALAILCKQYNTLLIADEVQSGYGRTGEFFAFQYYGIIPDIITIAKGMGNGFPIGGVLIHPDIKAFKGMLGTTFGGNHLACAAGIAVLEVMKKEKLLLNANEIGAYIKTVANEISFIKEVKGKGLMIGLVFGKEIKVSSLRAELLYEHKICTGNAKNPSILRILPPLTITKKQVDYFFKKLEVAYVKQREL